MNAFVLDPHRSACQAAIQSIQCANLDAEYEHDEQISACTAASELANWSRRSMAEIFINRGTAYRLNRDLDSAIADYTQAIRIDPTLDVAFHDRGLVYLDKGDFDRAIADFRQAIEIKVEFASAFTGLGDAYQAKGDAARAIAYYSEALRLGSKEDGAFSPFEAYFGRAAAYRAKGDFDRAIADYDAANRIESDTRVFINRGLTYLAKGDVERAIADFSEEIGDYAEDSDPYLYRGIVNLHSGRLSQALDDLSEAAALGGGEQTAYIQLWLDIAAARSKRASRLQHAAGGLDMKKWPSPIVRLYLGEMTYEATLAAADDPVAGTKAARICDTNFFAGELALRRGGKDDALRLLRLAAAPACGITIAWAANAELEALGATPLDGVAVRLVGGPSYDAKLPRYPIAKTPPPMPEPPPRAALTLPARTIRV